MRHIRVVRLPQEHPVWHTAQEHAGGFADAGLDPVDIMDVKCDPDMTNMIIQTYGFLPGYHMNKQHWITILLDGSVSEAKILDFLDMSYDLIDGAGRKENK